MVDRLTICLANRCRRWKETTRSVFTAPKQGETTQRCDLWLVAISSVESFAGSDTLLHIHPSTESQTMAQQTNGRQSPQRCNNLTRKTALTDGFGLQPFHREVKCTPTCGKLNHSMESLHSTTSISTVENSAENDGRWERRRAR